MNERIHILRQAIVVVTQALTNSDIAVTQEGIEAGVHMIQRQANLCELTFHIFRTIHQIR